MRKENTHSATAATASMDVSDIVFERHSHDRTISYSTIANAAKIPLEQVNRLIKCEEKIPELLLLLHLFSAFSHLSPYPSLSSMYTG